MSLNNLERRIVAIENRLKIKSIDSDYALEKAFDVMNETELAMIEEYRNLVLAGFDNDAIQEMLGDATYNAALDAVKKFDREYNRLLGGEPDGGNC